MRGYEYLQFIGSEAGFLNAELRFPFIEAMLTPIGVLGGIRGVLFANMGGARFEGQPFKWLSNSSEIYTPVVGFNDFAARQRRRSSEPRSASTGSAWWTPARPTASGSRHSPSGFPVHFDWAWRTLFNKHWEDLLFAASGGS